MKIFTIEQIKEIQKDQAYKYLALFDPYGVQICAFNSGRKPAADKLREIETRLMSAGLNDGYYIIKGKNSVQKHIVPDEYTVLKGSAHTMSEPAPAMIQAPPQAQPITAEVLTYESALRLQVENEKLKLENAALKKEIEELEELIQDQEESAVLSEEAAKPGLMENAKSFLTEAAGIIAPLLDQHFALKKQQLEIEALKLTYIKDHKKPEYLEKPQPKEHKTLETWITTFRDNPAKYNELAEIYNNANNTEEFNQAIAENEEYSTSYQKYFA